MKRLRYVVTGTGRSGTVYLARLLTAAAIPCGHESIFTPGGIDEARARLEGRLPIDVSAISVESCGDWLPNADELVADSSYMAAPYIHTDLLEGTRIIHAVRHPLAVINSFVLGLGYFLEPQPTDLWHEFIFGHLPELRQHWHPLERAALYYVRWNALIEYRARGKDYFFLRLEDGPARLLRRLGARIADPRLLEVHTVNTRMEGKGGYSFEDIPAGRVRDELFEIADRYGYTLSPTHSPRRRLWRNLYRRCRTLYRTFIPRKLPSCNSSGGVASSASVAQPVVDSR
jgi:hypothetical protein